MPQHERKLRDLLAFLAELKKRRLALHGIQQLRDVLESAAVVFAHVAVSACQTCAGIVRIDSSQVGRLTGVAVGGRTVVVSCRVKLLLVVKGCLVVMGTPVILERILVREGMLMGVHGGRRRVSL